jgi:hypothetical protein
MLRRRAILATLMLSAVSAHASGNLFVTIDHAGQLYINQQTIGIPVGTTLNLPDCNAATGPCLVMTDAQTGHVVGQALVDATGETLAHEVDLLIVHNTVVGETVIVRNGSQRLRIDLHPDSGLTLKNG